MIDRIAILVVDAAGVPKTNATPTFSVYRAAGVDRPPPTGSLATPIPHKAGGVYGCTASADDVAAGTAYVINAGPNAYLAGGGTRGFGAVAPANAPLFVQLLEDAATGALWGGIAPTLGIWADDAGAPQTPPAVFPIVAPYLYGFRPSTAELLAGRWFRWDAPAGAVPKYPHGVAFYGSGTPGTSLGAELVAELAADPNLTALVGARMYPAVLPQGGQLPALVYNIISTVPENTLDGDAADRLNTVRVQIDSWAKKYADAHAVADAVDQVVANLARPDLAAWADGSRDLYDNPTERHRVQAEYIVQRGRG